MDNWFHGSTQKEPRTTTATPTILQQPPSTPAHDRDGLNLPVQIGHARQIIRTEQQTILPRSDGKFVNAIELFGHTPSSTGGDPTPDVGGTQSEYEYRSHVGAAAAVIAVAS